MQSGTDAGCGSAGWRALTFDSVTWALWLSTDVGLPRQHVPSVTPSWYVHWILLPLPLTVYAGPELLDRVGGQPSYMGWGGGMLTDSGGFQMVSLAKFSEVMQHLSYIHHGPISSTN